MNSLIRLVVAALVLSGCNFEGNDREINEARGALEDWFGAAESGETNNQSCHAFGLIDFPEATCAEMLSHAGMIQRKDRVLTAQRSLECFTNGSKRVCGSFFEFVFRSKSDSAKLVNEQALIKRDDDLYRLYLYRSDLLFTTLSKRESEDEVSLPRANRFEIDDDKKRLYIALTNRLPPLYQFPFCIGLEQVSSEKLIEPLIPNELVTIEEVQQKSTLCPEDFCLTFVGESLALICD